MTTSADFADLRPHDTTAAATVLREAQAAYEVATSNYYQQRDLGGIVRADDPGDIFVKWKAATPAGAEALTKWQRARAELTAALANRRRELERWT